MRIHMKSGDHLIIQYGEVEIEFTSFLHAPENLEIDIGTGERGKIHSLHSPVHAGWADISFATEEGLLDSLINTSLILTISQDKED